MNHPHIRSTGGRKLRHALLAAAALAAASLDARADAVTDWNVKAGEILVESKLGTPPAIRAMAIVQTAVHDALQSLVRRGAADRAPAAIDAAVAAANRATLLKLLPAQEASIEAAYRAAIGGIADGPAKNAGIAAGEAAAAAVLAARADDGAAAPERYRPRTSPGVYVPTATPAASQWAQRKPWVLSLASEFRPGPPPALDSAQWARDLQEVKSLGARQGSARSAEQTEIARFWEYSLPPIYQGIVRSVALAPGRDAARNARLFAAASQAMDDALIAVFDAKYHYHFWRPVTAIRNADIDGHDATEVDAGWSPLIDTPMHPEYPAGHTVLAGAVAAVLKAETGRGSTPELATSSPSARGATRRWKTPDDLVREVVDARVYDGVHYRFSGEAGAELGRKVGERVAAKLLHAPH